MRAEWSLLGAEAVNGRRQDARGNPAMFDHDLMGELSEDVQALGYTRYCAACAVFFRDERDAEWTECRPLLVDPRQELPR